MIIDLIWNKIMLKRKCVLHGRNLKIFGRVHIHGSKGKIRIGDNCTIISNEDKNPTAGVMHSHLVAEGNLIIGNNVGMSLVNISAKEQIIIEDNVLLGAGVKIWDTDFHPISYEDRKNKKPPKTATVLIKEGVFIGACSIVLKGVTIGSHSVVGAGSVVTQNIPDNEVWAGNPARFIKRIDE